MTQTADEPTMGEVSPNGAAPEPAPDQPQEGWTPDDDQIAQELVPKLKDKVRYFRNSWQVYDNGCWVPRAMAQVRRYVKTELRAFRARGIKVQQRRVTAIVSMLEDELYLDESLLVQHQREQKRFVPLQNGLFDIVECRFLPEHRPDLYWTAQLPFAYDEDATCPQFIRFLETSLVFPDGTADGSLMRLAVEALGYAMTARTDLKASFWLVGQKDSGKSTFIAVVRNLMGPLHTTIDLTQLGRNDFLVSTFAGKRAVTFTEASSNAVLPDHIYKALVGGSDQLQANVKHKDPITFIPEAKIFWAMNDWPRTIDRSGATTRRIHMIPFVRTVPERLRITNLEDRLKAEMPGIFNMMVTGYLRLVRRGEFERCEQSEAMKQEYILQNDTEATFAGERLEMDGRYTVQAQELYDCYREWCLRNGFSPKARNQVKGDWIRLGLTVSKSSNNYYHGARIKETKF